MPYQPSFDRRLPGRIKKYMENSPGVDSRSMADDLQKAFKNDYGRRKKTAFRLLVGQVHKDILNSGEFANVNKNDNFANKKKKRKISKQQNGSSASCSDDDVRLVEYKDTNLMNKSLSSIYNKEEISNETPVPSKQPVSFDAAASENGWFIDRGPLKDQEISANKNLKFSNFEDKGLPIDVNNNDNPNTVTTDTNTLVEMDNINIKLNETKAASLDLKDEKTASAKDINSPKVPIKRKKLKRDPKLGKKKRKTDGKDAEEDFVPPFPQKQYEMKQSDLTFADFAGNEKSLKELARLLLHMNHPEIYSTLGVSPPRGVLLHGPPGCGKTLLGNAIAGQLNILLLRLAGPELIGGVSGESERRVREVFETATQNAPCVLFLDEIDAVAQRRENSSKDMERRIVAQLLTCMDEMNQGANQVMVVGATNRPEMLDTALRRAGRFDREICLGIPDEQARTQILQVLCKGLKLADDVSYQLIARLTPGYVGADLLSLCREAAMHAVNRILRVTGPDDFREPNSNKGDILELLRENQPFDDEKLNSLSIECGDFQLAVRDVQPSAKREGFATIPDVTWDDVGALESIRDELSMAILGPVRNPRAFAALGLSRASGVLLAGPPGCGKTMLAKAVANESGINFVSVKGPELLNMYVGESERAVRQCFERARNSAPCVIFFDELDSLCPRRSSAEAGASARVVNQMLTELDGLESRKQVFVIAATNRPDIIDPAVLRPGRLDKTLYVGIPTKTDLVKILRTITKNGTQPQFTDDVDLESLARDDRCNGFTGADLSALVRESALNALRGTIGHTWSEIMPDEDDTTNNVKVSLQNVNDALDKLEPSISAKDRAKYEAMRPRNQER